MVKWCALYFSLIIPLICWSQESLRFGVSSYPPYVLIENQLVSGIDIDIIVKVTEQLNYPLVLVPCPWKRCLKMMELGQIDMLGAALFTKERAAYMKYVTPQYISASQAFYTSVDHSIRIEQYDDLKKLVVGRELGSTSFEPFQSDPDIKKVDLLNQIQALEMLTVGRIDAAVGSDMYMEYIINKHGYHKKIIRQPYAHLGSKAYFTVSKKSKLASKMKQLNGIMLSLLDTGFIQSVLNKNRQGKHFQTHALLPQTNKPK